MIDPACCSQFQRKTKRFLMVVSSYVSSYFMDVMYICIICLLILALGFCNRCFGKCSPVRYHSKDWKVYKWPGLWWRKMRCSSVSLMACIQ